MPRTRAPPQGSTGSGNQQADVEQENLQQWTWSAAQDDDGNIPSNAVTSSTSRPKRSSYPEQDQRRQSQVTFAKAPPLDPSDSISQMNARSTPSGPNRNSDRRLSRQTRTSWNNYGSQVTRSSSQNGVAWSGSGPALTENNLERFNEENEKARSTVYSDQEPPSDQQEVPRSNKSKSRRQTNATNGGGAQTNGTARRSSRRYRQVRDVYSQAQSQRASRAQNRGSSGNSGNSGSSRNGGEEVAANAAAAEGAGEAVYSSQSRGQSVAVSRNVVDANNTQTGATQSKSKAVSQSRSRRDSKFEGEEEVAQTSNENAAQSSNEQRSHVSRSKLPLRPSQPSGSPTSPTSPAVPWGYERRTKIITKRWPDGTEVREREVRTLQPVGGA